MRLRVTLGRFLIRLGKFIQSLAIVVMQPQDLVEFSQLAYCGVKRAEGWGADKVIERGLYPAELSLLDKIPLKQGELLVLGVGGGREAIYLAQQGFEVTGLDFVSEMVEKAKDNALKKGLKIDGLVQEISNLCVPDNSYDVIWLSAKMYSCVPTRTKRIEMLKRIRKALRPSGYFACQFHFDEKAKGHSKIVEFVRKLFALLTMGNLWYEPGDMLWGNIEFIHAFSQEAELTLEFEEAGFKIDYFHIDKDMYRGEALLLK